jgi:LysR family glycine cleavage system transcriptional activator
MVKSTDPDQSLIQIPSLQAVQIFIVAARYKNFTRAAEALCLTRSAVSRQVRELEKHLGSELFKRIGRTVELTAAGLIFYDNVQLSFIGLIQTAEQIRNTSSAKR